MGFVYNVHRLNRWGGNCFLKISVFMRNFSRQKNKRKKCIRVLKMTDD